LIKGQKISLGKFMGMVSYKCTWKLIMGYNKDLKTWTRCGQDFPYPKEIFLAHKKCGTLRATTLYSWANWQLFASIPSHFYFFYWSMFMYCIWIISLDVDTNYIEITEDLYLKIEHDVQKWFLWQKI
jgi:hypothetical protein